MSNEHICCCNCAGMIMNKYPCNLIAQGGRERIGRFKEGAREHCRIQKECINYSSWMPWDGWKEKIEKLLHHEATTVGLWATDKPEKIPEEIKKDFFFQIEAPK